MKVSDLEPFFCRVFPLTIVDAILTLDDEHCPNENRCCSPTAGGDFTIFEVCAEELRHVLGEEGFRELRDLARL